MNLVLCQSAQGIKQIKWVILFVHFPHLVLILLQKVLIFLVQVKLDDILRPEQSAIFKQYETLQEAFTEIQDSPVNFTDEISLMFLGQTIFSVILSHSFFAFY